MNADPLLELRSVSKHYPHVAGNVSVVNDVDMTIARGEFVALSGPSGSGKTTLLMLATLLDFPSAGRIVFEGRDTAQLSESERSGLRAHAIGVIFQNYHLMPRRSVLQNVLFRFRYTSVPPGVAQRAALLALDRVGLRDSVQRPAGLLSGGEMQRVAIARAIASGPRLLAADEPTGNLDAHSTTAVMECLAELNALGTAVLLVTHNESLLDYAHRRLYCRRGALESAA